MVVVVIAVLALAWWAFSAFASRGDAPVAEPTATVAAGDTSATSLPSASASESASPAEPAEPIECANADITVAAEADAKSYPVGSTPKLTMTITNSGDSACLRDVGPKANELEITSGGYHVWSSDDCNASSKSKIVTLKPGDTFGSSITWSGRLSQKGCPNDEEGAKAKAGRYVVTARNGKVTSDGSTFALTASEG